VESEFSAAHKLRGYDGDCERLHGHNYRVAATVVGEALEDSGMLVDFRVLREALSSVLGELDHRCLNDDVPAFGSGGANPTAENIARWTAEELRARLPRSVRVARVTVWESERSSAAYLPGW